MPAAADDALGRTGVRFHAGGIAGGIAVGAHGILKAGEFDDGGGVRITGALGA